MNTNNLINAFVSLNLTSYNSLQFAELTKYYHSEFSQQFGSIDEAWQHLACAFTKHPADTLKKATLLPPFAYQYDSCRNFFEMAGATGLSKQNSTELDRVIYRILFNDDKNLAFAEKILEINFPLSARNWNIIFYNQCYSHLIQKTSLQFLISYEKECLESIKLEIANYNAAISEKNKFEIHNKIYLYLTHITSIISKSNISRFKFFHIIFEEFLNWPKFKEIILLHPLLKQIIIQQFDFNTFYKICSPCHKDLIELFQKEFFIKHLKLKEFYQIEGIISKLETNLQVNFIENCLEEVIEEIRLNFLHDIIFYNRTFLIERILKTSWAYNLTLEEKELFFDKTLEFANLRIARLLLSSFSFELPLIWNEWLILCQKRKVAKIGSEIIKYLFLLPEKVNSTYLSFFESINKAILDEDEWRVNLFLEHHWITYLDAQEKEKLLASAWSIESEEIACLLFDKGVKPSRHLMDKNNWLHLCYSEKNWYGYAKRLFSCGKNCENQSLPNGIEDYLLLNHKPFLLDQIITITMQSTFNQHLKAAYNSENIWYVHQLLDVHSNFKISNDLLSQLFAWSIDNEFKDLLKKLYEKCEDIDFSIEDKDNFTGTLFEYALDNFKINLFEFFIQNNAGATNFNAMHRAAWQKDFDLVKELLKKSPKSINAAAQNGYTLLHIAIVRNDPPLFHFLMKMGCDINKKDKRGRTPLHLAKKYGRLMMLNHLVDSKAKLNSVDNFGNTPINIFTQVSNLKILKKLLSFQAKIKNDEDTTEFVQDAYLQSLNLQFLNLFKSKIDVETVKESVERLLLAHAWSIGGQSQIKNFKFNLEGSYASAAVKILKKALLKYYTLPEKHYEMAVISRNFPKTFLESIKHLNTNLTCPPSDIFKLLKKKIPVVLHTGWVEHAMSLTIHEDRLVVSNRGLQGGFYGIEIYEFDPALLTEKMIRQIQEGKDQEFICYTLLEQLNAKFIRGFQKKNQTVGNCTDANLKTIPQILYYLLLEKNDDYDAYQEAYKEYKSWIKFYLADSYRHYIENRKIADDDFENAIKARASKKGIKLTPRKPENQESLIGSTNFKDIMGIS